MTTKVTEKVVKDKIAKILKVYTAYNNIYTLCPMTFGYGESGHPDRLILVNGTLIGIEAKRDKNNSHSRPELKAKPNEVMQKVQARNIINAGGEWYCIHHDNLDLFIKILETHCPVGMTNFSEADKKKLGAYNRG